MPKLKTGTITSSPEEEAAIYAGIAADPDASELTDEWFAEAVPFAALPKAMQAKLLASSGKQKAPRKISPVPQPSLQAA